MTKIGDRILYDVSDYTKRLIPGVITEVHTETVVDAVVFGFKSKEPAALVFSVVRGTGRETWQPLDKEGENA